MNGDGLTDDDRARIDTFLSKPPYERDFSDLIPADDETPDDDETSNDEAPAADEASNDDLVEEGPERGHGVHDSSEDRDEVRARHRCRGDD